MSLSRSGIHLASGHRALPGRVTRLLQPRFLHLRPRISVDAERIKTTRKFASRHASVDDRSTIFALSTPPGRSAIAVIRVSGPAALHIYRALCPAKQAPKPRYATVRGLYAPDQPEGPDSILDPSALVLYFPQPRTVTGEDVLELHVHGGTAVVQAVLSALPRCPVPPGVGGIRYAEPGEFTRRAFTNDRLDLTQVEALSDTLSAATEQQRRLSVRGVAGGLAKRYDAWRQMLLLARGELEALIDFSEDQHFDESSGELLRSVAAQVRALARLLAAHARNAVRGELLRNGIGVALLGAPNAGKSSLLNCIVGREAAIVSQEAGTTRDVVEVGLDLGGYLCRLGDTAGLRRALAAESAADPSAQRPVGQIEQEGMRRARERAADSDVVLVVLSLQNGPDGVDLHLEPEVIDAAARLVREKDNVVVAINKTDLLRGRADTLEAAVARARAALPGLHRSRVHLISCRESAAQAGESTADADPDPDPDPDPGNVRALLQSLIAHFADVTAAVRADDGGAAGAGIDADPSIWQESLGATERHRLLLEACVGSLEDFISVADAGRDDDDDDDDDDDEEADVVVAAEHLRSAADCLAKITGRGAAGDVEEVLGVVFEKFCVGK